MARKISPKKKARAHQQYKNAAGKRLPGVTTITGIMDKPALVNWANRMGLEGVDVRKYVNELADIGTLAHKMVEDYIAERETDFADYTPNQKDTAENAVLKFYAWEKENDFEPLESELQMVSEEHQYGGTCDIYCKLNGKLTLLDLKTGKGVYDDGHTQVTAYEHLLAENDRPVEDVRILRIGREESEGFDDIAVVNRDLHWKRFLACREVYELNKAIKRGGK